MALMVGSEDTTLVFLQLILGIVVCVQAIGRIGIQEHSGPDKKGKNSEEILLSLEVWGG